MDKKQTDFGLCAKVNPPPQKKKTYTVHWLPSTAEQTHADSMVSTGKGTTVKFTARGRRINKNIKNSTQKLVLCVF